MVVSETLRMYPPLGFLDRVANQDYKVPDSDLIIEKGTPIMISMIGMHYDPRYFPNPKKFDPERFNEVNKKNIQGYVYFPFGEGPHVCIGKNTLGRCASSLTRSLFPYRFRFRNPNWTFAGQIGLDTFTQGIRILSVRKYHHTDALRSERLNDHAFRRYTAERS